MSKPAGSLNAYPGFGDYQKKIASLFGSRVVAHFPLWEASGTTITDVKNGYNGTYSGVTLGAAGIGDGHTAASFDGATSYGNNTNAGLKAAIDVTKGAVILWARVADASVWTDGALHRPMTIRTDGNNQIYFRKSATNNQFSYSYTAGAVSKITTLTNIADVNYMCLVGTWDVANDAAKFYYNGVQQGAALTGLGTWAGAIGNVYLGANSTLPGDPWKGLLAHMVILNNVPTDAEIVEAATV